MKRIKGDIDYGVNIWKCGENSCNCSLNGVVEVPTSESETINGKVVNRNSWKEVEPHEMFDVYNVSDFALENLIASGAIANLKNAQYGDVNIDEFSRNLDNAQV